jgi:hypothetical protein
VNVLTLFLLKHMSYSVRKKRFAQLHVCAIVLLGRVPKTNLASTVTMASADSIVCHVHRKRV